MKNQKTPEPEAGKAPRRRSTLVEGIEAAAGRSGIPKDVLKRMKECGCEAFKPSSRVDVAECRAWLKVTENVAKLLTERGRPQDVKLNEEVRRLRRENEIAEGEVILTSEHEREITEMANAIQSVLYQGPTRLAPDLAGRPAIEIEQRLTIWIDEAVGKLGDWKIDMPLKTDGMADTFQDS